MAAERGGRSLRTRASRLAASVIVGLGVIAGPGAGAAHAIFPVGMTNDFNLRVNGSELSQNLGGDVANAGDVNGDGVPDQIVSGINASRVWIVFGRRDAERRSLRIGNLQPDEGYEIRGELLTNTGWSVANASDVNGDGIPDHLIGARAQGPGSGAVFVVFGHRQRATPIDLAAFGAPGNTEGYRIDSGPQDGAVGSGVADIGDINGDGVPDHLIGAGESSHTAANSGSAYVVFGQRSSTATIHLGTLSEDQGYRIDGAAAGDNAGNAVANTGDINGDGRDDALLGADDAAYAGRFLSGAAYVVFLPASSPTPISLASLDASRGYRLGGSIAFGDAGGAVAGAGDVNGDGVPDSLIGAPSAGETADSATGLVYVIFGQRNPSQSTIDLAAIGTPGNDQGILVVGAFDGSGSGGAVDNAGDVNGDGIPDLMFGASLAPPGEAYVVFGRRSAGRMTTAGIGVVPGNTDGFVLLNENAGPAATGAAVANAGDIDGDGFPDMLVTAPFNSILEAAGGTSWAIYSRLTLPWARTDGATAVTTDSATVHGAIGSNAVPCQEAGTPVQFQFEWGPTTAYGSLAPTTPGPGVLGQGEVPVSAQLSGLQPGTTYHYRVVAFCADGGRRFGRDRTFTTAVPSTPPAPSVPPAPTPPPPADGLTPAPVPVRSTGVRPRLAILSRTAAVRLRGAPPLTIRPVPFTGGSRFGVAPIRVRCRAARGASCAGRLTLSARVRGRTVGFGSVVYRVPGGRKATLRVRLGARARALLARAGSLRTTARTATRVPGSRAASRSARVVRLRVAR